MPDSHSVWRDAHTRRCMRALRAHHPPRQRMCSLRGKMGRITHTFEITLFICIEPEGLYLNESNVLIM